MTPAGRAPGRPKPARVPSGDRAAYPTHEGHQVRKRFGQHFLTDRHYIDRIVAAIAPARTDNIVEIGPGPGALTRPLLEKLDHLHVVELDRDLASALRASSDATQLSVHEADALDFDFNQLPAPLRIVGNLPYNVSTPLLFHITSAAERMIDGVFMLQKEVIDRMVAEPDSAEYGRLSVMLQYRFAMRRLFLVPPGAFHPPPKVDSAIVRMIPIDFATVGADATVSNDEVFAKLVASAFSQRRKMLRNTLREFFSEDEIAAQGIAPTARAEDIAVSDYVHLANRLAERGLR